jgi:hypothetical protein
MCTLADIMQLRAKVDELSRLVEQLTGRVAAEGQQRDAPALVAASLHDAAPAAALSHCSGVCKRAGTLTLPGDSPRLHGGSPSPRLDEHLVLEGANVTVRAAGQRPAPLARALRASGYCGATTATRADEEAAFHCLLDELERMGVRTPSSAQLLRDTDSN